MDTDIRDAFLEGMQEVYGIMFTDQIFFSELDLDSVVINIYKESNTKTYKNTKQLIGRIELNTTVEEPEDVSKSSFSAVITIPTKELIDKGIPHSEQDYDYLKTCKFTYKEIDYFIKDNGVLPKGNITDTFLTYRFLCAKDKSREV